MFKFLLLSVPSLKEMAIIFRKLLLMNILKTLMYVSLYVSYFIWSETSRDSYDHKIIQVSKISNIINTNEKKYSLSALKKILTKFTVY